MVLGHVARRRQPVGRRNAGEDPNRHLHEANAFAQEFFEKSLWEEKTGREARAYLKKSGVGRETAERFGLQGRAERCLVCPVKEKCPFYLKLEEHERHKMLYLENEQEDGYFRDRCVFSDQIDIWDNMSISVRYSRGALLNYMLHSYCPTEGYRIEIAYGDWGFVFDDDFESGNSFGWGTTVN